MTNYNPSEIEPRWQKFWADNKQFKADETCKGEKYYCLVMFPYPSGKLHMGHVRNYSIGDVFARFFRMKGRNVIHPIGWDAFGLPAENAAIKNKTNPHDWTKQNIKQMREQLKMLGISYDWDREIATCDPEYYKWNQWFFIKMWEKGLAFKKKARVYWCPSCKTVLANEQVTQGLCWRCDSKVEDKELEQWFVKITDYAEELLDGHKQLEQGWPHEVLAMQKNWIGKSTGAEVQFEIESTDGGFKKKITIFTTRPDTLFGATFMVIAPEHKIIEEAAGKITNLTEVRKYIAESKGKTTIERTADKEKTGIKIEGLYALNPAGSKRIPVFIADYVLMDYGTGAIMAVPAHDQRDWDFAKKFGVEIIEVIHDEISDISKCAYEGEGVIVNSGEFNGTKSSDGVKKVTAWLENMGLGKKSINYKLKEWLISRQRYWGTPIPMVYCSACGIVPEDINRLPVLLPTNVELTGAGESPLATNKEFVETKCPKCGKQARRETDTMDTFVDSSWYFLRYCDPKNKNQAFTSVLADKWLPVDQYVGGIEHACMHLIYSRFWHKFANDIGMVKYEEPFTNLLTQGMVTLGGTAMSKSRGNIVTPDEIIAKFGADTARLFILFAAPPEKQLDWSQDGLEGCWRFINRVWRLAELINASNKTEKLSEIEVAAAKKKILSKSNKTIYKVGRDIATEHQFNTAISAVMELVNEMYSSPLLGYSKESGTINGVYKTIILLLSPFTPHMCEEVWAAMGNKKSITGEKWPVADPQYLVDDKIELPVQINGKMKAKIEVPAEISEQDLKKVCEADTKIKNMLGGKKIIKIIYVAKKIVNIIIA